MLYVSRNTRNWVQALHVENLPACCSQEIQAIIQGTVADGIAVVHTVDQDNIVTDYMLDNVDILIIDPYA